jgi:hypothetical protein
LLVVCYFVFFVRNVLYDDDILEKRNEVNVECIKNKSKHYFYFYQDIERRFLVASAPSNGTLVYSPPPRYESIVKADDITAFNNLCKSRYLDLARKSSHGTASDSDGVQSNNVSIISVVYQCSFNKEFLIKFSYILSFRVVIIPPH